MNTIKVFHENIEVANHSRAYVKGAFQRKTEHAPAYLENVWKANKEGLEILAEKRGGAIEIVVKQLLSHSVKDRLHAVRRIFDLEKAFGQIRLEAACKRSLHFGEAEYSNIKSILERGLDFEKLKSEDPPSLREGGVFEFCRTQEQYQI